MYSQFRTEVYAVLDAHIIYHERRWRCIQLVEEMLQWFSRPEVRQALATVNEIPSVLAYCVRSLATTMVANTRGTYEAISTWWRWLRIVSVGPDVALWSSRATAGSRTSAGLPNSATSSDARPCSVVVADKVLEVVKPDRQGQVPDMDDLGRLAGVIGGEIEGVLGDVRLMFTTRGTVAPGIGEDMMEYIALMRVVLNLYVEEFSSLQLKSPAEVRQAVNETYGQHHAAVFQRLGEVFHRMTPYARSAAERILQVELGLHPGLRHVLVQAVEDKVLLNVVPQRVSAANLWSDPAAHVAHVEGLYLAAGRRGSVNDALWAVLDVARGQGKVGVSVMVAEGISPTWADAVGTASYIAGQLDGSLMPVLHAAIGDSGQAGGGFDPVHQYLTEDDVFLGGYRQSSLYATRELSGGRRPESAA